MLINKFWTGPKQVKSMPQSKWSPSPKKLRDKHDIVIFDVALRWYVIVANIWIIFLYYWQTNQSETNSKKTTEICSFNRIEILSTLQQLYEASALKKVWHFSLLIGFGISYLNTQRHTHTKKNHNRLHHFRHIEYEFRKNKQTNKQTEQIEDLLFG